MHLIRQCSHTPPRATVAFFPFPHNHHTTPLIMDPLKQFAASAAASAAAIAGSVQSAMNTPIPGAVLAAVRSLFPQGGETNAIPFDKYLRTVVGTAEIDGVLVYKLITYFEDQDGHEYATVTYLDSDTANPTSSVSAPLMEDAMTPAGTFSDMDIDEDDNISSLEEDEVCNHPISDDEIDNPSHPIPSLDVDALADALEEF